MAGPLRRARAGDGLEGIAAIERSVYDAVIDGASIGELTISGPVAGLDVVPSAIALAGAEVELAPDVMGYLRAACARYRALGPLAALIDEIEGGARAGFA